MTDKPVKPLDGKNPRVARLFAQIDALAASLRAEGMPVPKDVPHCLAGLEDDEKRILSLLKIRSRRRLAAGAPDAAQAASDAGSQGDDRVRNDQPRPPELDDSEAPSPEDGGEDAVPRADAGEPMEQRLPDTGEDAPPQADAGEPTEPRPPDDAGEEAAPRAADAASTPEDETKQSPDPAPESPTRTMMPSAIPKVPGLGRKHDIKPMEFRLPNGRVRVAYAVTTDRPILSIIDDGGSGLLVDSEGGLGGTPRTPGDFMLSLEIEDPHGMPRPASARFTVIADPQDLWKSQPSDRSDPYWKADAAVDTAKGEAFLVAASLRGRSHAQKGGFREDDCAIRIDKTGWHLLVVADGAGSARMSRRASKVVCDTAVIALTERVQKDLEPRIEGRLSSWEADPEREMESIKRDLLYPVLAGAAHEATKAIIAEAEASETPLREYSTTLLCAIARRTRHGWLIASFSVGDGGVVLFDDPAGEVNVLCSPDSGEYAGQTSFLEPSVFEDARAVMARIHCTIRPSFTALSLMTDGITDPFFPTDTIMADPSAWTTFWHDEIAAKVMLSPDNQDLEQQMIDWLGFWSKGNHDDRTIALLIPEDRA